MILSLERFATSCTTIFSFITMSQLMLRQSRSVAEYFRTYLKSQDIQIIVNTTLAFNNKKD